MAWLVGVQSPMASSIPSFVTFPVGVLRPELIPLDCFAWDKAEVSHGGLYAFHRYFKSCCDFPVSHFLFIIQYLKCRIVTGWKVIIFVHFNTSHSISQYNYVWQGRLRCPSFSVAKPSHTEYNTFLRKVKPVSGTKADNSLFFGIIHIMPTFLFYRCPNNRTHQTTSTVDRIRI